MYCLYTCFWKLPVSNFQYLVGHLVLELFSMWCMYRSHGDICWDVIWDKHRRVSQKPKHQLNLTPTGILSVLLCPFWALNVFVMAHSDMKLVLVHKQLIFLKGFYLQLLNITQSKSNSFFRPYVSLHKIVFLNFFVCIVYPLSSFLPQSSLPCDAPPAAHRASDISCPLFWLPNLHAIWLALGDTMSCSQEDIVTSLKA